MIITNCCNVVYAIKSVKRVITKFYIKINIRLASSRLGNIWLVAKY